MGSRHFRLNFSYPTEEEIEKGMDILEESLAEIKQDKMLLQKK